MKNFCLFIIDKSIFRIWHIVSVIRKFLRDVLREGDLQNVVDHLQNVVDHLGDIVDNYKYINFFWFLNGSWY